METAEEAVLLDAGDPPEFRGVPLLAEGSGIGMYLAGKPFTLWSRSVESWAQKGKYYSVFLWSDGVVNCSCPDFTQRKQQAGWMCKHLKALEEELRALLICSCFAIKSAMTALDEGKGVRIDYIAATFEFNPSTSFIDPAQATAPRTKPRRQGRAIDLEKEF